MNRKEAFKLGFARELASRGITPSDLEPLAKTAGIGKALGGAAVGVGLVPALLGLGLGYGYQRSADVSEPDLKSMKEVAMLKEYEAAIKQLERERGKTITA